MASRRRAAVLLAGLIMGSLSTGLHADDWLAWRGSNYDGIAKATNLPTEIGPDKNVAWKQKLPGEAGATPIVVGQRVLLTSLKEDKKGVELLCLDRKTGNVMWTQVLSTSNRNARGDEGNSASPSPVSDGKHVWTLTGSGEFACHDLDGKKIWESNIEKEFGDLNIQFGYTSSPVLVDDKVIIQIMVTGMNVLAAVDKQTGKTVWKHQRKTDATAENEHSYTSPILYQDGERTQVIAHGADYVTAHDPKTGDELWRRGDLHVGRYNPTLRFVASPSTAPGLIVVPTAKNGMVLAIDPTVAKGDFTKEKVGEGKPVRWVMMNNTPDVPSPLISDGIVYLCRENGTLITLEAKTGKEIYKERVHSDRYRASPLLADGKLYLSSRDGTISVVSPGKEFKLLASNKLKEAVASSPIAVDQDLFVRTFEHLYCFRQQ